MYMCITTYMYISGGRGGHAARPVPGRPRRLYTTLIQCEHDYYDTI